MSKRESRFVKHAVHAAKSAVYLYCAAVGSFGLLVGLAHWVIADHITNSGPADPPATPSDGGYF